ncbi:Acyl dehydratase OS=Streptomyces fumanus OX=67302 GN=GCM10018772_38500 PE=4 SV=1 [Streptomyces fumanus]
MSMTDETESRPTADPLPDEAVDELIATGRPPGRPWAPGIDPDSTWRAG